MPRSIDNFVFLAVLFAAACHAGWNVLIKIGLTPLRTTTLISLGAGAVSLALLPFTGLPAAASWPWLIASVILHLFYFAGLIESYRVGDLGQVYPIARGAAPLMTAVCTALWIGEKQSVTGWAGIAALIAGVFMLSARGGRGVGHLDLHAIGFAFFTALMICAYSVVDGIGGRLSHDPQAYSVWLFVGIAAVMLPYALIREGRPMIPAIQRHWRRGLAGGAMQLISYGIAIWAMTQAPIALVAALRETSVLFGVLLAALLLKEPLRPARLAAALLIVTGLALVRLQ
jgi:drug/metabolite transporter (DMT)-like permease